MTRGGTEPPPAYEPGPLPGPDGGPPDDNLPDLPIQPMLIDVSTTRKGFMVATDNGVMRSNRQRSLL